MILSAGSGSGPLWAFFHRLGISNFERGPKADFFFYVRAQFVAEIRRTLNVILATWE